MRTRLEIVPPLVPGDELSIVGSSIAVSVLVVTSLVLVDELSVVCRSIAGPVVTPLWQVLVPLPLKIDVFPFTKAKAPNPTT